MRLVLDVLDEPEDLEKFIRIRLTQALKNDHSIPEIAHSLTDTAIGFYVGNSLACARMGRITE